MADQHSCGCGGLRMQRPESRSEPQRQVARNPSMKRRFLILATIFPAGFVTGLAAAPTLAEAPPVPAVAVEPIALLLDGKISGCGVTARFAPPGAGSLAVSLTLIRDAESPTGTRFVLGADHAEGLIIRHLSLTTGALDTSSRFTRSEQKTKSRFETSAVLEPLEGGELMRSLMISGAAIAVQIEGLTDVKVSLPGPVPAGVRSGYLNCAGDLFRPEDRL